MTGEEGAEAQSGSIATLLALGQLGFRDAGTRVCFIVDELVLDLGPFSLYAASFLGREFRARVHFGGSHSTRRAFTQIEFDMPTEIESVEQCAAWITWHIDKDSLKDAMDASGPPTLVATGRANRHLLPWVRQQAAFDKRPCCYANRDWVRVLVRKLWAILENVDSETVVTLGFDGAILTIGVSGELLAMPARGNPWGGYITVGAGRIKERRRRLPQDSLEFSFFNGRLFFADTPIPDAKFIANHSEDPVRGRSP